MDRERQAIQREIDSLNERLDLVYPASARAALKEQHKEEAQRALQVMASLGGKLGEAQAKTLMQLIERAQHDDEEDERSVKKIFEEQEEDEEE